MSASAERVRDFLIEQQSWPGPRSELTDELPLIENRVLDSVGLLRLVSWLEEEFAIIVGDEEVVPANFGTIARIAQLVDAKTSTPA
jgi:acyl carrier protein